MLDKYVKRILQSRVYDVAVETPIHAAPLISKRIGNRVLLKREDLQPVFSFKLRGAYNKLCQLTGEQLQQDRQHQQQMQHPHRYMTFPP